MNTKNKKIIHRKYGIMRNVRGAGCHRSIYPDTRFHIWIISHFSSFFVLLAGLILGADKGAISVGCYVLLGLVGVPIFAAGGGIGYIFRPSFGYLVGFIVSAYVTGKVCEKLKASYKNYLLACLAGFVVTYAIGIVYKFIILNFYAHTPATLGVIFLSCFPLDMPGDFVLCLLAAGVGLRMRKSGFYLS